MTGLLSKEKSESNDRELRESGQKGFFFYLNNICVKEALLA